MRKSNPRMKIALPDGHLQDDTRKLFRQAGLNVEGYDREARSYRPTIAGRPEIQIKVLRPQEIPRLVELGTYHIGVTGHDWLEETRANVQRLLDLEYGGVDVVLAIPEKIKRRQKIYDLNDLLIYFGERRTEVRIATEYIHLTERHIKKSDFYRVKMQEERVGKPALVFPWMSRRKKSPVKIVLSYGTTEGKPPEDADAIIDNTSTGRTLEENGLAVVDTIIERSTAWLVANRSCHAKASLWRDIRHLARVLHWVVMGRKFLHIFANLPKYNIKSLRESNILCESGISDLAQHSVTVVESNRGARIDLLVAREDYEKALDSLHSRLGATDIVALQPHGVAWPSRATDDKKAPYLKL